MLEHLYEKIYIQRLHTPNEAQWRCRIVPNCTIASASRKENSSIYLQIRNSPSADDKLEELKTKNLDFDYVFAATGYKKDAHEEMLAGIREILPADSRIAVGRNYGVIFEKGKVAPVAGIWLQGCNEATHGVSLLRFLFQS